jgi:hypothetical protein
LVHTNFTRRFWLPNELDDVASNSRLPYSDTH